MKMKGILCLVGLCSLGPGCGGPLSNVARTLIIEPAHFCKAENDWEECTRNRKLAETAWIEYRSVSPGQAYSPDWERGFKDGFADYLYAGGTGLPPPVPPRDYWTTVYETESGHRAIEDWFEGFRRGAQAARDSGYRDVVTIPVSSPPVGTPLIVVPAAPAEAPAPAETLPAPRREAPKAPLSGS
jgi:hypothetical protein